MSTRTGHVWPEMLDGARDAGIRNYTIFRDGNQVFGYFESDDLERAAAYLATQEVTRAGRTRWPSCSRSACPTPAACARGDLPLD